MPQTIEGQKVFSLNELSVGKQITYGVELPRFSRDHSLEFCQMFGDKNAIHWDLEEAVRAGYNHIVFPGMMILSAMIATLADILPQGIALGQLDKVKFRTPVHQHNEPAVDFTVLRKIKRLVVFSFSVREHHVPHGVFIEGRVTAIFPK